MTWYVQRFLPHSDKRLTTLVLAALQGHMARTNGFLVLTQHELALRYNDKYVHMLQPTSLAHQ